MQTYNATVRLAGKLENEVSKTALTTPEVLILRKIHGVDAIVKIEPAGHWDEHYSSQTQKDENNEDEEIELEFDPAVERDRLIRLYGDAIANAGETPADAFSRMFGEYAPLPEELPELKVAKVKTAAPVKAKTNDALKKVS